MRSWCRNSHFPPWNCWIQGWNSTVSLGEVMEPMCHLLDPWKTKGTPWASQIFPGSGHRAIPTLWNHPPGRISWVMKSLPEFWRILWTLCSLELSKWTRGAGDWFGSSKEWEFWFHAEPHWHFSRSDGLQLLINSCMDAWILWEYLYSVMAQDKQRLPG